MSERARYRDIAVGDIVEFGSRTTEWVVIDHPANSDFEKMIRCIQGPASICGKNAVRLVTEDETDLYLCLPAD